MHQSRKKSVIQEGQQKQLWFNKVLYLFILSSGVCPLYVHVTWNEVGSPPPGSIKKFMVDNNSVKLHHCYASGSRESQKGIKGRWGSLIGRQKAIRIVDGSEYCWVMAQENKDKLAANSDDKKRLYRVEIWAGGKLKAAAAKGQEIELLRKNWRSRVQLKPSPAQLLVTVPV